MRRERPGNEVGKAWEWGGKGLGMRLTRGVSASTRKAWSCLPPLQSPGLLQLLGASLLLTSAGSNTLACMIPRWTYGVLKMSVRSVQMCSVQMCSVQMCSVQMCSVCVRTSLIPRPVPGYITVSWKRGCVYPCLRSGLVIVVLVTFATAEWKA